MDALRPFVCVLILGFAPALAACSGSTRPGSTTTESFPSETSADTTASQACSSAMRNLAFGSATSVIAAESATAPQIVKWEEGTAAGQLAGTISSLRSDPPDTRLTVCRYAAKDIKAPRPRGAPTPDTLTVLIDSVGNESLESASTTADAPLMPLEYLEASDSSTITRPLAPPTSAPRPTTGQVTLAAGVQNGKPWSMVMRPTPDGFCYGVGYGSPRPNDCFSSASLRSLHLPVITAVNADPCVLIGITPPAVTLVEVTISSGELQAFTPATAPGYSAWRFFARGEPAGTTALPEPLAYDANGEAIGAP